MFELGGKMGLFGEMLDREVGLGFLGFVGFIAKMDVAATEGLPGSGGENRVVTSSRRMERGGGGSQSSFAPI